MIDTILIKKYKNRKLYDTSQSSYVTLEEIGESVRDGFEVRVVENATKKDITAETLLQIMFERERKRIADNHRLATNVNTLHQALRMA